jgi:hypothetical protein
MPPKIRRPLGLERLEDRVTPAGNILVSSLRLSPAGKFLTEVTQAGSVVRTINVPSPTDQRDIIVAPNGDIDVFNGTFGPVLLSTYGASSGGWSSLTTTNWSTVNNLTYGGVAASGNYAYVTDMTTGSETGPSNGIIRFNMADGTAERFHPGDYLQLTIGLDGRLYALGSYNGFGCPYDVFDPVTMQQIGHVLLPLDDCRSLAVTANGDVFAVNLDRTVYHFDAAGNVLGTLALDSAIVNQATDINVSTDGQLVLGTNGNHIVLTDTSFSSPSYVTVGTSVDLDIFVAFADPQFPPTPPALSGIEPGPLGYGAGQPAKSVTDSMSLVEQGANTISGASVRITSGFTLGDDWLHFTPEFGITGVYDSDSGVLTLNGSASVLAYQEALRDVTYANTNLNPPDATRTVTFQVTGGTADHLPSNTVSRDVHVTPHAGPSLTNIESSPLVFTEGDAAKPITASLTLTDPDSVTLCAGTVSIGAGYTPGEDVLEYTEQFGIDGDFYPATGVLSLYGAATVAEWQTVIQSITYVNTSTDPSAVTRTITFQVDDNFAFNHASNTESRNVTITPVNTPPALTVPNPGPHGSQGGNIAVNGITAADPDAEGATEDLTLSVSHGAIGFQDLTGLTIDGGANNSVSVTVGGTITALNAALSSANLVYHPDAAFVGTETLSLVLNDDGNTGSGGAQSSSKSVSISVSPHVPPTLSGIELAPLSFTEGGGAAAVTNSLTITPGDSATLAGAIVSITHTFANGEDVLGFADQNGIAGSYDPSLGVLTLSGTASIADYQAALRSVTYRDTSLDPSTASRTIRFTVDDGFAFNHFGNAQSRTVNVTAVNTPPSLAVPSNGPSGTHDTDIAVTGISVADVDADGASESLALSVARGRIRFLNLAGISIIGGINNSPSVTISGPIANLNAALAGGNLVYRSFVGSSPTDSLNLTLNDNGHSGAGGAQTASASFGITLNPFAPVLGGVEASALAFTEGGAAKRITAALTVASADSSTTAGATVAITGGFAGAEDVLGFVNEPIIKGSYDAATGVLTLTGAASVAQYQMALRSVTYRNTSHDPSTSPRTITFQVDDGLAINNLSNSLSRTVAVAAVNTAPTLTVPTTRPSGPSNTDFAIIGLGAADVDADGAAETLTLSVAHGAIRFTDLSGLTVIFGANDSATVTVQGTLSALNAALGGGNLAYHSAFSFAGSDTLKLALNDGGSTGSGGAKSATKLLSVSVVHVAPVLSGIESSDVTYTEGDPATTLTGSLTISSIDRLTLAGATVRISSFFQPGQDVLAFAKQNGIIGTYNALAGILTLSGVSSVANYEAALRSVTYRNSSQNPSTAPRAISFQVRDGSLTNGSSNVLSRTLTVTGVNNAPTITLPTASPKVKHDVDLHLGGIILADVDAKGGLEDLTLTVGNGRLRFVNLTGLTVKAGANDSATVTVEGTLPHLITALANGNLVYHSDAQFTGADMLDLDFDDNGNTGIGGPLFVFKSFPIIVT